MLSLSELRRAAAEVDTRLRGARIERVVEPSPDALVFTLYGRAAGEERGSKYFLFVSCHPELGRISELDGQRPAPESPPHLTQWLRSRLAGARIASAEVAGDDRELSLHFDVPGEDGMRRWTLVLSLLGRRANTYLIDSSGKVAAAQRPFEKTRKDLRPGSAWGPAPIPAGSAPRPAGPDRFADEKAGDLLRAIEAAYSERETSRVGNDAARRAAQALRKERKQTLRRLEKLEAELSEADQASTLQQQGELLKLALPKIGKSGAGQTEVTVEDPSTGTQVTVPLDPKLGPKQNIEAIFKRAQKLMRRLVKAGGQIDSVRERLAAIEALESELATLEAQAKAGGEAEATALDAFASRAEVAKMIGKREASAAVAAKEPPKAKGPFKDLPTRLHPRRYRSLDELEIWVGRSDECNDHLSTRLARGKDLFFHVQDSPGSHVILRTEGRTDPPSESLLDACELAVHFSKQKRAPHAEVHVVPIKNVKKPKGAKPGLVYVTGGKSIHLRREASRLERLLAARIES